MTYIFIHIRSQLTNLRPGVEITPVNGDPNSEGTTSDKKATSSPSAGKGSKLESALDRLGLNKRKVNNKAIFSTEYLYKS